MAREAEIFGTYLAGQRPGGDVAGVYAAAVRQHGLESIDDAVLAYVVRHPGRLKYIDAALAFSGRESLLRKKLFIMFCVLEAHPDYCDHFLARADNQRSIISLFFLGIRSAMRIAIGKMLLLFL